VFPRAATLRIARPADQLEALTRFSRDGLGCEVRGVFPGHGTFDGVMPGHPGTPWNLEFAHGHAAGLWRSR
jgi:hypothetical protein